MVVVQNSVARGIWDFISGNLVGPFTIWLSSRQFDARSLSVPLYVWIGIGVVLTAYCVATSAYVLFHSFKFLNSELAFDHRGFEVRTADGSTSHSWDEVGDVKGLWGSKYSTIMDKEGGTIYVTDQRARGYTKLKAWLNVFPNRS